MKILASKPTLTLPGEPGETPHKKEDLEQPSGSKSRGTATAQTEPTTSEGGHVTPNVGEPSAAVKEKVDWDGREDHAVVTLPYLDDEWKDIEGKASSTKRRGKLQALERWWKMCGTSGHPRRLLRQCFRTWGMSETSSPSQPPPSIWGEPADEAGDKDRSLDHDEFFKQVMEELKSQGETGGKTATSHGGTEEPGETATHRGRARRD